MTKYAYNRRQIFGNEHRLAELKIKQALPKLSRMLYTGLFRKHQATENL